MSTLVLEMEPIAVDVVVTEDDLGVELADGRSMHVPLSWYPRLFHASEAERQSWRLLGDGYAIEWPDLDEHIGIEGLLAGRHSGESPQSLKRWLAARRPDGGPTSRALPGLGA
jgi:hypothetical protein